MGVSEHGGGASSHVPERSIPGPRAISHSSPSERIDAARWICDGIVSLSGGAAGIGHVLARVHVRADSDPDIPRRDGHVIAVCNTGVAVAAERQALGNREEEGHSVGEV